MKPIDFGTTVPRLIDFSCQVPHDVLVLGLCDTVNAVTSKWELLYRLYLGLDPIWIQLILNAETQ